MGRSRFVLRLSAILVLLAGVGLLVAAAWTFLAAPDAPPAPHPIEEEARSVVLVTVDTTRADRLEPYGAENVATPALQRLADSGVVFEQAFSVAPITLVAHTSILSGLDPPRHGVRNNGIHYVPDEIDTLAERLRREGWRTGAFVSAAVLERRYNLDQGFEVYDDDLSSGRERHRRMVPDRPAEATVRSAVEWLDSLEDDAPYFLWVHLYDPHAAYSPPPPYRDEYRERLYDGEIAYMDEWIGKLLRHPKVGDQTLVSVLGDHGESLGEHGEQTHALLAYDSTLHVPWILRGPGLPEGRRLASTVSQVDLLPTVLELVGIEPPPSDPTASTGGAVSGRSLVPVLEGVPERAPRQLYAETWLPYYTYGWARLRVLRQGRYKWIDGPDPELYDTSRDPRELTEISEREPGLAHDLSRDLRELLDAVESEERSARLELDAEAREKLRSLGYLSTGGPDDVPDDERPDPKAMSDVHVGLERARFLFRDRLYDAAERELRRVLRRDPGNVSALIDLSTALAEQEKLDDAVAAIERALTLDPDFARLHVLLAGYEARRGEAEKALELYDAALELDPRSEEARLQKVMHLRRMRRPEAARELLEETLELHPDSPPTLALHAQIALAARGETEAAEAQLRRALELDPFLVGAWRQLAALLERQGRMDEAIDAASRGLERSVDDPDLHARLGILLARHGSRHGDVRQGQGADAEKHLREALRLGRGLQPEVRTSLGAWLAERGRFAEAEEQYEAVLAERPNDPATRNNLALTLLQTGRLDEAREQLETLVARHPRHADAHNNLAALALYQDRPADAEAHARRALELRNGSAETWNNLGLALAGQGRDAEARPAFERAVELREGYWQARFNLGSLLARRDAPDDAREQLEEVLHLQPRYPDVHLELGDLHAGPLDDPDAARRHYNAFLRLAPQDPRSGRVREALRDLGPS